MTSDKDMWWPFSPPGGGKKRPLTPKEPSPAPTILAAEETAGAKEQVRGRRRGRPSTILAGRLMSQLGKAGYMIR